MAWVNTVLVLVAILATMQTVLSTPARRGKKQSSGPITCPGFPGYCSESYAGDVCLVVCARGRNNVPECQDDGTWTDVPRCIEHEPGVQSQVPGLCPGIPGYCSLDNPGGLCTFECPVGPAIRSSCTADGTWDPYPTCFGDPRETQDGCDPCPGPNGASRNRTAEAGGSGGGNSGSRSGGNSGGGGRAGTRNGGGNQRNGGGNNGGANPRRNGNGGQRNNGNNNNKSTNRAAPRNNLAPPRNNQQTGKRNGNGNRRSGNGGGGSGKGGNSGGCPGEVLEACIDVCPGFSARVFSACVAGCARRCPARK